MKKILTKALPHVVALLIFAAVSALFFAPQFEGKSLRQGDVVQHAGTVRDIQLHKQLYGEHPQWAGTMFSGMPSYLLDMNYDGRYVKVAADNLYFLGQPTSFLFLAMAGFYLMLLMFGVGPWVAIVAAVGYGLSSYFPIIIGAGHITKMMAMCWVAPMIGSIYYAYASRRWVGVVLAGIFAAIEISCSHPQITYYFLFAVVGLFIWQFVVAFRVARLRRFFLTSIALVGAAVLAVGANIVQLYYVGQYSADTTRGRSELSVASGEEGNRTTGLDKDYATAWSYGVGETLNLFIPNLVGGTSEGGFSTDGAVAQSLQKYDAERLAGQLPGYWGSQPFTSGPVYLGAVMVFLFVFGLFVVRGGLRWWVIGVSILSLALAWGHNMMWFTSWMLDYFPMYNKFRSVSMILVLVQWTVPFLAAIGLERVLRCVDGGVFGSTLDLKVDRSPLTKEQVMRGLKWALGITGGVALVAALILPSALDFVGASDAVMGLPEDVLAAMQVERADLLRSDGWRSLIIVGLSGGLLFCYLKGWLRWWWMILALGVITCVDLYNVDRRYLKTESFQEHHVSKGMPMSPASKEILRDTTNYRVANFSLDPFKDATTSYYHRSVGGYHAAKLRRYQDLIDRHLSRNNMAVYDMLNTKYFIDKQGGVVVNPHAAGNAWFVDSLLLVGSADQEIAALDTITGFDARQVAVVDSSAFRLSDDVISLASGSFGSLSMDSSATIELTSYRVNRLTYRSKAAVEGVAVFSEIYYPKGWTVYVDGQPASYFRADYVLRAMVVPAGDHVIEWRFAAPHFSAIVWITRISSLILLVGLGVICLYGLYCCFGGSVISHKDERK